MAVYTWWYLNTHIGFIISLLVEDCVAVSKSDPGAQHRDYGNLYVEVKEKRESVMMLAVSFRMSQSLCVCVCHAGVIYSASKSQCLVFHRMSVTTTSKCWCHVTTKLSLHVEPMRSTPPVATTRYDESISVTHIHTHLHTVITSYRWVDFWSFLLKNQNWQSTCTHLPKFVSIKMNLNIRPVQNRIYSALSQKWINILFFFSVREVCFLPPILAVG